MVRTQTGGALDGIVAKRLDAPYQPGERAMLKVKQQRTADCVVGGYRTGPTSGVGSLLLGLYDGAGKLDYVGFTSSFSGERARRAAERSSSRMHGPSRVHRQRARRAEPLEPGRQHRMGGAHGPSSSPR